MIFGMVWYGFHSVALLKDNDDENLITYICINTICVCVCMFYYHQGQFLKLIVILNSSDYHPKKNDFSKKKTSKAYLKNRKKREIEK